MKSAFKLLSVALKQVGTKEVPAGSNNVKYNTWFYGHSVNGAAYPWCCAFVNWCFYKAGMSDLFYGGKKSASCMNTEEYMRGHGQKVDIDDGRFGDIAFMDFGKGRISHIGIIIQKNSDGTYKTVEGNTSVSSNDNGGAVMIRTRSKSYIKSICRPDYELPELVKITGTCRKFAKKSVSSKVLEKFSSNNKVRWMSDCKDGWSKVISLADGEVGYVKNKYIAKKGLSTYKRYTITEACQLRESKSITSKAISKLTPGDGVGVITRDKVWSNVSVKVNGNSVSGYVKTKFLKAN